MHTMEKLGTEHWQLGAMSFWLICTYHVLLTLINITWHSVNIIDEFRHCDFDSIDNYLGAMVLMRPL